MLELKDLIKIYGKDAGAVTAAVNINLTVGRGEFVCITGRSGSGKSTVLNMTAGLLRPTGGTVVINGRDLWAMPQKEMARIRNSVLGYIPQGMSLFSNLTVLDNVRLPHFLARRRGNAADKAMSLLAGMEIDGLAKRFPCQLSGGQIRRAAIARALINSPEIIIADEPTSDLDEETAGEVIKTFTRINAKGVTVLMVTHERDIREHCGRVLVMDRGKLIEH